MLFHGLRPSRLCSFMVLAVLFHGLPRSLPLQGEMEEVTKPADACALVSMSRRNKGNIRNLSLRSNGTVNCPLIIHNIIHEKFVSNSWWFMFFFLTRIAINYPLIIHIIINSWKICVQFVVIHVYSFSTRIAMRSKISNISFISAGHWDQRAGISRLGDLLHLPL